MHPVGKKVTAALRGLLVRKNREQSTLRHVKRRHILTVLAEEIVAPALKSSCGNAVHDHIAKVSNAYRVGIGRLNARACVYGYRWF